MTTNTRIANLEKALQSRALAFVQQKYGLTERDLEASANLRKTCSKVSTDYADAVDALVDAVNAHHSENTDPDSYNARIATLWDGAGLDREKQYTAGKTIVKAFEIPAVVTIETLLELDRLIYEACRIGTT